MPDPVGSFNWLCRHAPLPHCNLFFARLWSDGRPGLLFPKSSEFFAPFNVTTSATVNNTSALLARAHAGTGVAANCEIARVGHGGSLSDIGEDSEETAPTAALVLASALSFAVAIWLMALARRRLAAVGRVEIIIFHAVFAAQSALQAVTSSSVLEQGSVALSILSALHLATSAALCWILILNAVVAAQFLPDGKTATLWTIIGPAVCLFGATIYFSLGVVFTWPGTFTLASHTAGLYMTSYWLFVMSFIWPILAVSVFTGMMLYVILHLLIDAKKAAAVLLIGLLALIDGQIVLFAASQPLCDLSNGRVNGAFIAAVCNTLAVGLMHITWTMITDSNWSDMDLHRLSASYSFETKP